MAMYGKALGNGYAINAVIGKREIMEAAQTTFISSTFWTERIGPAAAVATLKEMKKLRSWEVITSTGEKVKKLWEKLADENGLDIKTAGIPALSTYSFNYVNPGVYKTFVTQEMLKRGFLASTLFYACTEHTDEYIGLYGEALNEVYGTIRKTLDNGQSLETLLEGPVCHSGFSRLN